MIDSVTSLGFESDLPGLVIGIRGIVFHGFGIRFLKRNENPIGLVSKEKDKYLKA